MQTHSLAFNANSFGLNHVQHRQNGKPSAIQQVKPYASLESHDKVRFSGKEKTRGNKNKSSSSPEPSTPQTTEEGRLRNRQAAKKSREKQNAMVEALKAKHNQLETENGRLKQGVEDLKAEKSNLLTQLLLLGSQYSTPIVQASQFSIYQNPLANNSDTEVGTILHDGRQWWQKVLPGSRNQPGTYQPLA